MHQYKTWAEIDLSALRQNLRALRARMQAAPHTPRLIAVVKANAYGHGVSLVAPALAEQGCDFFAVACSAEAQQLYDILGGRGDILLLGYSVPEDAEMLWHMGAIQTVFSSDYARELSAEMGRLIRLGKLPPEAKLRIHLKLDTGMNRLGFDGSDAECAAQEMAAVSLLPHLAVEGLFTHFACADTDHGGEMSLLQHRRFTDAAEALRRRGCCPPMLHCCNSAAALHMPRAYYDAVRAGVILYGMQPDGVLLPDFRPVMTLWTRVAHVHTLRAGESLSYGATFTAERDMQIATVPIGYADGFLRSYGGASVVLPDGKQAPIVGRICMDQCMIALGDSTVRPGDPIRVFGGDGGESVEALARRGGTINYEITSILTARVPRVRKREE